MSTGGPAFPAMHFDLGDDEHGMTLRDYFAAKAMQGLISSADWREAVAEHTTNDMAATKFTALTAYEMADAMLKAREQ
jgi:hypothetical protein